MPDKKKPGKEEQERGGFNPVPVSPAKEQFGPLPTDAPGQAKADDKKQRGKSGSSR